MNFIKSPTWETQLVTGVWLACPKSRKHHLATGMVNDGKRGEKSGGIQPFTFFFFALHMGYSHRH